MSGNSGIDEQRRRTLADIAINAKQEAEKAEQTLSLLGSEYLPEAIFAAAFTVMVAAPEGCASELTHGDVPSKLERLAFHLWRSPSPGTKSPTSQAIQDAVQALHQLTSAFLIGEALNRSQSGDDLNALISRFRRDAQLIRGSAYPEQTSEEIREIAGHFDPWFHENLGASATQLVDLLWSIPRSAEAKINKWLSRLFDESRSLAERSSFALARRRPVSRRLAQHLKRLSNNAALDHIASHAYLTLPIGRIDCQMPDGSHPSVVLWNSLISLIGLTRQHAIEGTDFLVARRRPLFTFGNGRVLVADLSNAFDCLWDALDARAKTDEGFYQRFQARKAEWLEEKTTEDLRRVFGDECVYKDLVYPDPDKPDQDATTQLDLAIRWGPFLVLGEAKAKQFRLEGQLGDVGRLRTDLKANVEDAFHQALRAQRYLASVDEAEFRERRTDRVLRVQRGKLRRIYLITVSLHLLGTAINRLANLQKLGLFANGEYPWAVSLADLDIITRFVEGPHVFLHYLERRRAIERGSIFPLNDDLDLFGAYLKTRLHPSAFESKEGGKAQDFVYFSGFHVQFDEWMEFQRGRRKAPPEIRLEIPDTIRAVLQELHQRQDDDAARWIEFALLGLSASELNAIAQGLKQARSQEPKPGMYLRLVVGLDDIVVSMTVTGSREAGELRSRTQRRTAGEKYRRRVSRSIGFGIHTGQHDKPFDCCVWVEGPWRYDPIMEELLQDEPPFSLAPGQKPPGRNEPCFCGSGKKFKRCCLPKISMARKSHW
jgi:hypothetical protein